MTKNKMLIVFAMLVSAGCSHKAVYDNMRNNERNECFKEPTSDYFECVERTNKPYEEYKRERKALLESESLQ